MFNAVSQSIKYNWNTYRFQNSKIIYDNTVYDITLEYKFST